jgi:Uma2 family endonuclease
MASDMQVDYRIRPISAREYHLMGEQGIIGPDERVELLDGELIAMPPIGPDHSFSVRELTELFVMTFAGRARVDVHSPMALDEYSEPEPDLMLLRLREDRYRTAIPAPSDVLLVIEVANSSWRYDRGRKLRAYARNGIAELWIVHLAASRVIVFRDPKGDGYADERSYARGETLAPSAFPNDPIPVDAILP